MDTEIKARKLTFEKPKFQSCYLPCSFKERYEKIAKEQLLSLDDEVNLNDKDDCPNFFQVSWSEHKPGEAVVKEENESFGQLLYDAVRLEHDEQSKGALTPWEICSTQKLHDRGYIKEQCSWKQESKRQFSSRKPDKRRLQLHFDKQPVFIQRDSRKCDQFEEKPSEKESSVEGNAAKEETARANQPRFPTRSILKFRHFYNPRDFIVYYRDNITYFMIQQHLCRYVNNWQAAKSFKTPTQTATKETPIVENKKTQIFRLQISTGKNQGFGVLRVGRCPTVEASKRSEFSENSNKEEKKVFKMEEKQCRETRPETLEMSITGSKPPSSDMHTEVNNIQRKLSKAKMSRTLTIPKASNIDLSRPSFRGKEDYDDNDGKWKEKVKTVELQIVKAGACKGSRAKGATSKRLNRPKNKPTPPPPSPKATAKKRSPAHNACYPHIVCSSHMTNMIFADKQFLRITTPKPIGVNPANQRGSSSKLFDNHGDSIYPWAETLSHIPRGRLINETQILGPYARQFPDKRFQACITPSSYPSSSINVQIQGNTDECPVLEQCQSEGDMRKITSKKSFQKVDPFYKL